MERKQSLLLENFNNDVQIPWPFFSDILVNMLKKEKKRAADAMKYAGSNYNETDSSMPNGHHSSGKKVYLLLSIVALVY